MKQGSNSLAAKIFPVCFCIALYLLFSRSAFALPEIYTHRLSQSTAAYLVWTAPPSERVFKDTAPDLSIGLMSKRSNSSSSIIG